MILEEKELFEQVDFEFNELYETIITDIAEQKYSIVDGFFNPAEVDLLRSTLIAKHKEDAFKKAAIGNRTNELIEKSVRGDFILWMNEATAEPAEFIFFQKVNDLVQYLNRTCSNNSFSLRIMCEKFRKCKF